MTDIKYVAFDVHLATISAVVLDISGKLITQAVYRSQAIKCAGRDVYYTRNRQAWLEKLKAEDLRQRAQFL